jgi:hypothetical protein
MLTPRKQAGLSEGDRLKYKGQIVRVDYAGIDSDQRAYIEVYLSDGGYRIYRDDPELSELSNDEQITERQKKWNEG